MKVSTIFKLLICVDLLHFAVGHVLKILATSPMTGNGRSTGIPCVKAMEIVVNATNEREDILEGFTIEMVVANDAFGPLGARAVGEFYRQHVEGQINTPERQEYPSPIVVGFMNSLNGVIAAPILPHINMVMVTTGGISPVFTLRKHYFREMYRIRKGVEMYVPPIAKFMKDLNWDKVALLFSETSVVGFSVANLFMRVASNYNITVQWSNNVNDIDDQIAQSLRQSNVRIIFLTNAELPLSTKYMCQLYKHGFNDSRYVILSMTTAIQQAEYIPPVVPGGCTKAELLSMYNFVLFFGSKPFAIKDIGNISMFDYGLNQFNERFYKAISGVRQDDLPEIQFCHDGMLATIIGLHQTNEKLRTRGLTLRNYLNDPTGVVEAVKETLRSISFTGIREDNYHYSERLEFDSEPIVTMQWTDNKRWEFPVEVVQNLRTGEFVTKTNSQLQWHTKNGKAPKGWPNFKYISVDVPRPLFYSFLSISCLGTMLQVAVLIKFRNFILFIGCCLLNSATVLFVVPTEMVGNLLPLCLARLISISIGIAILSITWSLEIFTLWRQLKWRKKQLGRNETYNRFNSTQESKFKQSQSNLKAQQLSANQQSQGRNISSTSSKVKKFQTMGIVALLVLYCAALIVWLAIDGHRPLEANTEKGVQYGSESDTFTTETYKDCTSHNFSHWSLALVLILIVPMLFLSVIITLTGRIKRATGQEKLALVSVVNIISIVLITIFAVLLVHSIVTQRIIVAVACWILSFSNAAFWKFRAVKVENNDG